MDFILETLSEVGEAWLFLLILLIGCVYNKVCTKVKNSVYYTNKF